MIETEFKPQEVGGIYYPLNKEEAQVLLALEGTPAWEIFLRCIKFEAEVYSRAALNVEYGPNALEKFRFNQALAQNLPRIPAAIMEAAKSVTETSLDSLYDQLYLSKELM